MTTQEQLDQINAAITAIEAGAQEYKVGEMTVKRANLDTLYKERRNLNQQLIDESNDGGGSIYAAQFDRR